MHTSLFDFKLIFSTFRNSSYFVKFMKLACESFVHVIRFDWYWLSTLFLFLSFQLNYFPFVIFNCASLFTSFELSSINLLCCSLLSFLSCWPIYSCLRTNTLKVIQLIFNCWPTTQSTDMSACIDILINAYHWTMKLRC